MTFWSMTNKEVIRVNATSLFFSGFPEVDEQFAASFRKIGASLFLNLWINTFLKFLSVGGWFDTLWSKIQALVFLDPLMTLWGHFEALISKCSMIPAWHWLGYVSGHVEKLETTSKLQVYTTFIAPARLFRLWSPPLCRM